MSKKFDPLLLTDEQQDAFIRGWITAGGPTDDLESPAPWCCPWVWANEITITDEGGPEEWGAKYHLEYQRPYQMKNFAELLIYQGDAAKFRALKNALFLLDKIARRQYNNNNR